MIRRLVARQWYRVLMYLPVKVLRAIHVHPAVILDREYRVRARRCPPVLPPVGSHRQKAHS